MKVWLVRLSALFAAGICIYTAIVFTDYAVISNQQDLFPFPGLYLIEIILLGLLGIIPTWIKSPQWTIVTWVLFGIYLPLIVLGMWSFGSFLIPAAALTFINAITNHNNNSNQKILITALFSAVGQLVFMYAVILIYI